MEIVTDLFFRDDEFLKTPFDTHIEYSIGLVNILVKINNVTPVYRDKLGYYCNNPGLIGTVHQKDCRVFFFLFHLYHVNLIAKLVILRQNANNRRLIAEF